MNKTTQDQIKSSIGKKDAIKRCNEHKIMRLAARVT